MADPPRQIYLGIAQKILQDAKKRDYLDSKTGMYKPKEYRPRSPYSPKLREYKPEFKEIEVREYVPKTHVSNHQYDNFREYNHTYEVEPPDDEDIPKGEPQFCKPYKALGSIKRSFATLFPAVSLTTIQ